MSETKAYVLFVVALLVISGAVLVACIKAGAGGGVLGLVFGLSCVAGGYFSSVIVMHYGQRRERQKREQLLISK